MALPPIASASSPITVPKSDGTTFSVSSPVTTAITGGVKMLGAGEVVQALTLSTNFYQMLEHFANSSSPGSPVTGQIWYDTSIPSAKVIKVYDGSAWVAVGGSVTVATTAPSSPSTGALWWDSNDNVARLFVWTGTVWADASPAATGSFVPLTSSTGSAALPVGTTAQRDGAPSTGYLRYNTTTSGWESWTGSAWSTLGAGIGSSQTWQNMTSSRAFNTTYTNSTGKPIELAVYASTISFPGGYLTMQINGVSTVVSTYGYSGAVPTAINGIIVPSGATYNIIPSNSNLGAWWELR